MNAEILAHLEGSPEWYTEATGVILPKVITDDEISFPSQLFESSSLEDFGSGWWSTHRNLILQKSLKRYEVKQILEVGAGNGGVAKFLDLNGIEVVCLEPHLAGARQIATEGILSICAFLEDLRLPTNSIRSIGFFDVLEHVQNPKKVLSEAHRVLESNSLIFIMVPAHPFLYSDFDKQIGHYRRYTRASLKSELYESGFEVIETKSMFISVLPIVILKRFLDGITSWKKTKNKLEFASKISKVLHPNHLFNSLLLGLISWERVASMGRLLPGVSLFVIARKRL